MAWDVLVPPEIFLREDAPIRAQSYAEQRGITFRERVAEIVRKVVPEKLRDRVDGLLDGLRAPGDGVPGGNAVQPPERGNAGAEAARREPAAPAKEVTDDPEAALRRARTKALVRHARAVDAIFEAQENGRQVQVPSR